MTNFIQPPQLKAIEIEHSSLQTGIISSAIALIKMRCLTEAAKTKLLPPQLCRMATDFW